MVGALVVCVCVYVEFAETVSCKFNDIPGGITAV